MSNRCCNQCRIVAAVAVIVGLVTLTKTFESRAETDPRGAIERPFTVSPVPLDRLQYVTPLGNLSPPAHTYPTDHLYLHTHSGQSMTVVAPGRIQIERVTRNTFAQGEPDFTIDFRAPNNQHLWFRFSHVSKLSAQFNKMLRPWDDPSVTTESWKVADNSVIAKHQRPENLVFEPGEKLGVRTAGSMDFWAKDSRVRHLFLSDQQRSFAGTTVCPFDYFVEPQRSALHEKFRTHRGTPIKTCGKINFDIDRTKAVGNWTWYKYAGSPQLRPEDFGLCIVRDIQRENYGWVISVGDVPDLDISERSRVYSLHQPVPDPTAWEMDKTYYLAYLEAGTVQTDRMLAVRFNRSRLQFAVVDLAKRHGQYQVADGVPKITEDLADVFDKVDWYFVRD